MPELDADAAQHEQPQHQHDREVEAGEARRQDAAGTRRTARRRRRAARPRCRPSTGPIAREHLSPLGVRAGHGEMQGAGAEIEPVEHDVGDEHQAPGREPESAMDLSALPRPPRALEPWAEPVVNALRPVRDARARRGRGTNSAEHDVQPQKPMSVKSDVPGGRSGSDAVRRAHQPVHDPRLPPELARHPAGRRRDVREREREHQDPEQRPRPLERARGERRTPPRPSAR